MSFMHATIPAITPLHYAIMLPIKNRYSEAPTSAVFLSIDVTNK
jgi:hypothetical protein